MTTDWTGSRILVLGLGDTGWSMTRWLAARGARLRVADTRTDAPHAGRVRAAIPDAEVHAGPFTDELFRDVDAIALSPGLDRRERPLADAIARGVPVMGDVEIFARSLKERGATSAVLAITGSNGKSTVTAMTGEVCETGGLATVVAGNIGLPVLDALAEIDAGKPLPDVFVLELSSFQLESTASLAPTAATMLNLSEDHLDRYDGMAGYGAAKARIFAGDGVQVLNREDAWSMGMALPGRAQVTFGLDAPARETDWGLRDGKLVRGATALMPVADLPVAGLHNAANALAAAALAETVAVAPSHMAAALRGFRGLPHRVERVANVRGITFYDDSKGTNVGSTVAALRGMPQPVVLIAGGDGKGQDFAPLAAPVADRARAVVLLGRDAPLLRAALQGTGVPLLAAASMQEAVELAYRAARAGDAVLLSPACASYDMFRSYVHRAEVFVDVVRALAAREA